METADQPLPTPLRHKICARLAYLGCRTIIREGSVICDFLDNQYPEGWDAVAIVADILKREFSLDFPVTVKNVRLLKSTEELPSRTAYEAFRAHQMNGEGICSGHGEGSPRTTRTVTAVQSRSGKRRTVQSPYSDSEVLARLIELTGFEPGPDPPRTSIWNEHLGVFHFARSLVLQAHANGNRSSRLSGPQICWVHVLVVDAETKTH